MYSHYKIQSVFIKKFRTGEKHIMNIFENNIKMDNLFGMYLLDRFPVFCYSDITDTVNVALIGESIIRDDFFKNVASVCHMIGKKLNVTVVSDDAVEFITRFI